MKLWFDQLKNAKKLVSDYDSLRTVLYEFKDGTQLEEEYNLSLNIVTRRAWREKYKIDKEWNVELGEPIQDFDTFIKENSSQPYVCKRNTRRMIEWKIKNLPYPSETYSVSCKEEEHSIIVKTTNRKYYKTLRIPELERLGIPTRQTNLSSTYNRNMLVIKYQKPLELIEFEKAVLEMVGKLKISSDSSDLDDPPLKKRKIIEL